MRPDQHKKKRSAQYKKKHGIKKDVQTKEKGKRGSHEDRDEVGVPNSTATTDTKNAVTEPVKNIAANEDNPEFVPSFSRRKIESNWDRYEGLPDENEEETITARGVEFNRLLSETGHAEAQFRFKDEQSWEEDEVASYEAGIKYLSVDVDVLARHIRAIPVPERLGISRSLFENDVLETLDKEAKNESSKKTCNTMKDGDKLGVPAKQSSNLCSAIETGTSNAEEVNVQRKRIEIGEKDNCSVDDNRTSKLNSNTEHLKESIKTSAQEVAKGDLHVETSEVGRIDSRTSEQFSSKDEAIKDNDDNNDDDELDFLLSLENPVQVKGQGVTEKPTDGETVEQETNDEDADAQSSKLSEGQKTDTASVLKTACHTTDSSQSKTGTDDLEDWLDDMLDD